MKNTKTYLQKSNQKKAIVSPVNKQNQQLTQEERLLTISQFTEEDRARNSFQSNYNSYKHIHKINNQYGETQTFKYSTSHSKNRNIEKPVSFYGQKRQQNVLQQKKSLNYSMCAKARQKSLNQKKTKVKQFQQTPQNHLKRPVSNQKSVNLDTKDQLQSLQTKIKELHYEVMNLQNKNVELQKQNIRLSCQAQMMKKQGKLHQKNQIKHQLNSNEQNECQKCSRLRDEFSQLQQQKQFKSKQISILTQKINDFLKCIDQLQTELKLKQNIEKQLKNQLLLISSQLKEKSFQCQQSNSQIEYLKSQVTQKSSLIQDISQKLRTANEEKFNIQNQYQKLQKAHEQTIRQSKRQIKIKLQETVSSKETLETLQKLKSQILDQKGQIKKLKEKEIYYQEKLEQYGQKIAFYQSEKVNQNTSTQNVLQKVFEQIDQESFNSNEQQCQQKYQQNKQSKVLILQKEKQPLKAIISQKQQNINSLILRIKRLQQEIIEISQKSQQDSTNLKRIFKQELDDLEKSYQINIANAKRSYQNQLKNVQSNAFHQEDVTTKYFKQLSQNQRKDQKIINLEQSLSQKNMILTDMQLKISQLTHKILQQGQNTSKKEDLVKSLQTSLKSKQKQIEIIKKFNQEKLSQYQTKLSNNESRQKQLREDMIHLMKEKQNLLKKIQDLQKQITLNQRKISEKVYQNTSLKQYQQRCDKVLSQNKYLTTMNHKIQQELLQYKKLLQESQDKAFKLGKQSNQINDQVQKLRNQVKAINKQIEDKNYKLKWATQQKQDISREVIKNTIKFQQSKKQTKEYETQIQLLNSQISTLRDKIQQSQRQNRIKLDQKQSNNMMMLNNLNRNKISLEQIQKQNKYLKNRLQNKACIQQELLKIDTKCKNLEKQNQNLKGQMRSKQRQNKNMKEDMQLQKQKMRNIQQENKKLIRQFDISHNELQQVKLFTNKKEVELQQLKKNYNVLKIELNTIQIKYKQKSQQVQELYHTNEEFKKINVKKMKDIEDVYTETREKYEKCKKELKKYRDKHQQEKLLIKNSYRYNQEIIQNCQQIINRCDRQPTIQYKMSSKRQSLAVVHRSERHSRQKQALTSKKHYNNVFEGIQLEDVFQQKKSNYISSTNIGQKVKKDSISSLINLQSNALHRDMNIKKYDISP